MNNFFPTLTKWLEYLEVQKGRAPGTLGEYRRDLQRFYRHLTGPGPDHVPALQAEHGTVDILADVTTAHISSYLVHLKRQHELSNRTISRKISPLKGFFAYAVRTYVIPTDPAADLDLPAIEERIPEDLSEPQIERLLAQVQGDDWLTIRDRAILQTLLNTGLRVGEVVRLDRNHIDLARDQVRVKQGKGNKDRIVPLNRLVKVALLDWLDRREDLGEPDTPAVFVTRRSRKRASTRAIQMMVEKYASAAGLPESTTPHTLRHTFATRLMREGVHLRAVQDLLGHRSPSTTAKYTHVNHQQRREAVHRLAMAPTDLLERR